MSAEVRAKVAYFEDMARGLSSMSGMQRARSRQELIDYYDSLDPDTMVKKYAAGGAVAAAILPGIGFIMGGLIGGAIAVVKSSDADLVAARERLGELIESLA